MVDEFRPVTGDQGSLFGIPVVESPYLEEGTMLIGCADTGQWRLIKGIRRLPWHRRALRKMRRVVRRRRA